MEFDITRENLAAADERYTKKMDAEDRTAMRLCLLSAGALAGLALKGKFVRRLAVLGCSCLAAGLAIPLAKEYLTELDRVSQNAEPLLDADFRPAEGPAPAPEAPDAPLA